MFRPGLRLTDFWHQDQKLASDATIDCFILYSVSWTTGQHNLVKKSYCNYCGQHCDLQLQHKQMATLYIGKSCDQTHDYAPLLKQRLTEHLFIRDTDNDRTAHREQIVTFTHRHIYLIKSQNFVIL